MIQRIVPLLIWATTYRWKGQVGQVMYPKMPSLLSICKIVVDSSANGDTIWCNLRYPNGQTLHSARLCLCEVSNERIEYKFIFILRKTRLPHLIKNDLSTLLWWWTLHVTVHLILPVFIASTSTELKGQTGQIVYTRHPLSSLDEAYSFNRVIGLSIQCDTSYRQSDPSTIPNGQD